MDIKKEKSKIQLDVHTHTVMSGHAFSTPYRRWCTKLPHRD